MSDRASISAPVCAYFILVGLAMGLTGVTMLIVSDDVANRGSGLLLLAVGALQVGLVFTARPIPLTEPKHGP